MISKIKNYFLPREFDFLISKLKKNYIIGIMDYGFVIVPETKFKKYFKSRSPQNTLCCDIV